MVVLEPDGTRVENPQMTWVLRLSDRSLIITPIAGAMAAALNPGRRGRARSLSCRSSSKWMVAFVYKISRTPNTKPLFSSSGKNISQSASQSSSACSYFLTVVGFEISTTLISIFIPSLARPRSAPVLSHLSQLITSQFIMRSSIWIASVLATVALGAPQYTVADEGMDALQTYFELLSTTIQEGQATSPVCDLSNAQMPSSSKFLWSAFPSLKVNM